MITVNDKLIKDKSSKRKISKPIWFQDKQRNQNESKDFLPDKGMWKHFNTSTTKTWEGN